MDLSELLKTAYNSLDVLNEQARIPVTFDVYWFDLGYGVETSLLSRLGKKNEWRASLYFGSDYDVNLQWNYFGKTPESAVKKMIVGIKFLEKAKKKKEIK